MLKRFVVQKEILEPDQDWSRKKKTSPFLVWWAWILWLIALIIWIILLLDIALGLFLCISWMSLMSYFYAHRNRR